MPIWTYSQGASGSIKTSMVIPVMNIIGEHEGDIDTPLSAQHGVATVNAAGKQRHAFVACSRSVQRPQPELQKILGLDQLR